MNIILWDIESMGFNADWDPVLCVGYKELGKKALFCPKISDYPCYRKDFNDDTDLLRNIGRVLSKADLWITHNGVRFDVPFLNARLIRIGLAPLPPVPHVDTYNSIARHGIKVSSRRLGALADFLGCKNKKESLGMGPWKELRKGTRTGRDRILNKIAKYCKQDVRTLEDIYNKLRVLHNNHPNVGLSTPYIRPDSLLIASMSPCPKCGICGLSPEGNRPKQTGWDKRFKCRACHGWSRAPISPMGKVGRVR